MTILGEYEQRKIKEVKRMKTIIFDSYDAFRNRDDKSINGVTQEFADKNPGYESDNETNIGCWDCKYCKYCADCKYCKYCAGCRYCAGCIGCEGCVSCIGCTGCEGCVSCIICTDCTDCKYCKYCAGCEDLKSRSGVNNL